MDLSECKIGMRCKHIYSPNVIYIIKKILSSGLVCTDVIEANGDFILEKETYPMFLKPMDNYRIDDFCDKCGGPIEWVALALKCMHCGRII